MRLGCSAALLLWAATIASVVEAVSRDNSYYRPGFVNPNLEKHPLYHKNAKNVLENLSRFKALYVKYENCAWAYYGNPYANRYNDEENYGWDEDGGGDDTTMGVEAFAAPLGVDTTYGNAYCTMIPPEDGNVIINDDDDDYYHDYKYNFQAFTSYGTGCSRGKFVTDAYHCID